MAKKNAVDKRYRFTESMCEQIKELSEEKNISETKVLENAFNLYYTNEVMPEHIVLGRLTQLQSQITSLDRKLETFAGIFYVVMPYILGVLPPLPKNEVDKDGKKFNPALDKGNEVFTKLITNYRNLMRGHKISFMQNVWADMQENLIFTHPNVSGDSSERTAGN